MLGATTLYNKITHVYRILQSSTEGQTATDWARWQQGLAVLQTTRGAGLLTVLLTLFSTFGLVTVLDQITWTGHFDYRNSGIGTGHNILLSKPGLHTHVQQKTLVDGGDLNYWVGDVADSSLEVHMISRSSSLFQVTLVEWSKVLHHEQLLRTDWHAPPFPKL